MKGGKSGRARYEFAESTPRDGCEPEWWRGKEYGMPKMKTHRGAAKRFKVTGTGKLVFKHAFKSHILGKKTTKRKRQLRKDGVVSPSDAKNLKTILGM